MRKVLNPNHQFTYSKIAKCLAIVIIIALQPCRQLLAQVYNSQIGLPLQLGQFRSAIDVAVDASGNTYVIDENTQVITKFDINGTPLLKWGGSGTADGQFTTAYRIAIDPAGNVYVADLIAHMIQKFTSTGSFITKWGSLGIGDGQFNRPIGIAIDASSKVYVVEEVNKRVQVFDSDGTFLSKWTGSAPGLFSSPSGIAVDAANVYVMDLGNNRVQKYTTAGVYIAQWGSSGSGDGQFNLPFDIATDGTYVIVSDGLNYRIQWFLTNGTFVGSTGTQGSNNGQFNFPHGIGTSGPSAHFFVVADVSSRIQFFNLIGAYSAKVSTTFLDGQFNFPGRVAVDNNGNLYVADNNNHRIQKFNTNGVFVSKFGSKGNANGQFNFPYTVAVDAVGNIYVSDTNSRIQKFDNAGNFITTWGSFGTGDGQFSGIQDITIDATGNVYVVDAGNNRIQKFSNTGAFLSKWGTLGSADGQFSSPTGLSLDALGNIYVCEGYNNHRVQKFDNAGNFLKFWGSLGSADGDLNYPADVAVDANGNIYIVDNGNFRIQKFDNSGTFLEKWGSYGTGDGQFISPTGIVIDNNGSAYIVDGNSARIEKFILPPTITSFTPQSGPVGTVVTITGNYFSTTAANNTVLFNGGLAAITGATTTTNIVAIVPEFAPTGAITVEVGGQIAYSGTDFTVTATSTSVLISSESFLTTYNKGSTLTLSVTVNDATKVSAVNFKSRGISEAASAEKSKSVSAVGNKYEIVVGASDLTDPIGLVYAFEVLDKDTPVGTVLSSIGKAYVKYPTTSTDQAIPDLSFGDQVSNYSIIAVPLELTNKTVTTVFSALGAYDKTKWRLFDYIGTDNREYPGFSTIDIGKGYWLIARNSVTINPGEGSPPVVDGATPFTINLATGWNLIGNPYNFRISWADVLTASSNPAGVDTKLKLFSGGTLTDGTVLDKYRGAFVFSSAAAVIKIPVTRNTTIGGRIKAEPGLVNSLDQNHWEVKLKLSEGALHNELGGIGMHPAATLKGKDPFDEVSVPLPEGLNLFELAYPHPEVFTDFNKEVVPTQENFTWNFDVKRSLKTSDLELTWANDYFGDNEKQLVLFDPSSLQVVDMRVVNHFTVTSKAEKLRILYGGKDYIQHALDKELPWLGNPYPNPAREELTIPFRVPESQDQMAVQIKIYNTLGAEVGMPVNGILAKGNYKITWQPQGETGMFIVRMKIGQQEAKATKVIIN